MPTKVPQFITLINHIQSQKLNPSPRQALKAFSFLNFDQLQRLLINIYLYLFINYIYCDIIVKNGTITA